MRTGNCYGCVGFQRQHLAVLHGLASGSCGVCERVSVLHCISVCFVTGPANRRLCLGSTHVATDCVVVTVC